MEKICKPEQVHWRMNARCRCLTGCLLLKGKGDLILVFKLCIENECRRRRDKYKKVIIVSSSVSFTRPSILFDFSRLRLCLSVFKRTKKHNPNYLHSKRLRQCWESFKSIIFKGSFINMFELNLCYKCN